MKIKKIICAFCVLNLIPISRLNKKWSPSPVYGVPRIVTTFGELRYICHNCFQNKSFILFSSLPHFVDLDMLKITFYFVLIRRKDILFNYCYKY